MYSPLFFFNLDTYIADISTGMMLMGLLFVILSLLNVFGMYKQSILSGGKFVSGRFSFRFFISYVNLMFNVGHDFGVGQQFVHLIYEYTQYLSFSNTLKWKRRRFSVPNE